MVTSPYELKILEWDDKPDTNKQTNVQFTICNTIGESQNNSYCWKKSSSTLPQMLR